MKTKPSDLEKRIDSIDSEKISYLAPKLNEYFIVDIGSISRVIDSKVSLDKFYTSNSLIKEYGVLTDRIISGYESFIDIYRDQISGIRDHNIRQKMVEELKKVKSDVKSKIKEYTKTVKDLRSSNSKKYSGSLLPTIDSYLNHIEEIVYDRLRETAENLDIKSSISKIEINAEILKRHGTTKSSKESFKTICDKFMKTTDYIESTLKEGRYVGSNGTLQEEVENLKPFLTKEIMDQARATPLYKNMLDVFKEEVENQLKLTPSLPLAISSAYKVVQGKVVTDVMGKPITFEDARYTLLDTYLHAASNDLTDNQFAKLYGLNHTSQLQSIEDYFEKIMVRDLEIEHYNKKLRKDDLRDEAYIAEAILLGIQKQDANFITVVTSDLDLKELIKYTNSRNLDPFKLRYA